MRCGRGRVKGREAYLGKGGVGEGEELAQRLDVVSRLLRQQRRGNVLLDKTKMYGGGALAQAIHDHDRPLCE